MADHALSLDILRQVKETVTHRVRRFGYGDGYEQVRPDGINTAMREYNIVTRPLDRATANDFRAALDSVCSGDYFTATLEPYQNVTTNGQPRSDGSGPSRYRVADDTYERQIIRAEGLGRANVRPAFEVYTFTLKQAFAGDNIA